MRLVRSTIALTLLSVLLGATEASARAPLAPAFSVVGFGDSLTIGAAPGSSYLGHLPAAWSRDPSPQGVRVKERLLDLEWLIAMEAMARDVAFIDLFAAIQGEPDPSAYFADDGIHLNAAGGAFAARQIERALTPLYDAWLAESRRL